MSRAQFQGQEGNRAVFVFPSQEHITFHASLLPTLPEPGTHGDLEVHFQERKKTNPEEDKQKNLLNALIYGSGKERE